MFATLEVIGVTDRTAQIMKFISFFLVFITAGLKYETGVDWAAYEAIFWLQYPLGKILDIGIIKFFSQFGFEPGYMFLTATIKQLGGSIQTVYFVIAFINILLLYKTLNYYTSKPILVLLGYYCFIFFILDMSGIRQAMAVNILLYGTQYAIKRNFGKFLFWTILATLFHQTAIIFIILYPLFKKQDFSFKLWLIIYIISLIIMLLKIRWMETVATLILPFLDIGNIGDKVIQYVFNKDAEDEYINLIKVLVPTCILGYCYIRQKKLKDTAINRFSIMCLFIFGIINNIMFELSEINARISAYMIIFIAIVISIIITKLKICFNRLIIGAIFITYCFFYASVYILEKPATLPYHPYQNYVIYQMFDIPSTGEERRDKFANQ